MSVCIFHHVSSKDLFYIHVCVLACLDTHYVYTCKYLQKPEEHVGAPGARVTDSCRLMFCRSSQCFMFLGLAFLGLSTSAEFQFSSGLQRFCLLFKCHFCFPSLLFPLWTPSTSKCSSLINILPMPIKILLFSPVLV